jgi:hypothetical protein
MKNSNSTLPTTIVRLLSAIVMIPLLCLAWIFSPFRGHDGGLFGYGLFAVLSVLSGLCLWFAIRGQVRFDRILMLWRIIIGGVGGFFGLAGGIFAYQYLYPQSNIAPMLAFYNKSTTIRSNRLLHAWRFVRYSFVNWT